MDLGTGVRDINFALYYFRISHESLIYLMPSLFGLADSIVPANSATPSRNHLWTIRVRLDVDILCKNGSGA